MIRSNERGIAIILAMFMVLAVSVLGASMMLVSRTETVSSQNYRSMSQARYGAESGVHRAINYLMNTYTAPSDHVGSSDLISTYSTTVSPVTYSGQPAVLSSMSGVTANYPVEAAKTAFANTVKGTLTMGGIPVNYTASAKMLSMRKVFEYGSVTGAETTIQTWLITGEGSISGEQNASVEVTATLERQVIKTATFGVFATAQTCGALLFGGGATTNSYDSSNMTIVSGQPVTTNSGGDVGTNGNLSIIGNASVYGSLSTPRTGVGKCNNGDPDAASISNNGNLTGGIITLPQALIYPTPVTPAPVGGSVSLTSCAGAGLTAPTCTVVGGVMTLDPQGGSITLGDVSLGGTVRFKPGIYNFDTLKQTSHGEILIDATSSSDQIILNITSTTDNSPLDLTGHGFVNTSFLSYNFRIQYAGTGNLKVAGNSAASALLYAPGATVNLNGGSDWWGAILAKTVDNHGGTAVHYDRRLRTTAESAGNYMLSAFSWQSYP